MDDHTCPTPRDYDTVVLWLELGARLRLIQQGGVTWRTALGEANSFGWDQHTRCRYCGEGIDMEPTIKLAGGPPAHVGCYNERHPVPE